MIAFDAVPSWVGEARAEAAEGDAPRLLATSLLLAAAVALVASPAVAGVLILLGLVS